MPLKLQSYGQTEMHVVIMIDVIITISCLFCLNVRTYVTCLF